MDIWVLIASVSFILSGILGGLSISLAGTESREKAWKLSILLIRFSIYLMVMQMYQHVMR
jgi:hypothetical protein